MKKKNLKGKLSLKVKDLSSLSGKEKSEIKGGWTGPATSPILCDPCYTRSCPQGGYSCHAVQCVSA